MHPCKVYLGDCSFGFGLLSRIADEYSGFDAAEGIKLNGKLTLGENTADNGGLRIALMALESALSEKDSQPDTNGFTP